MNSIQNFMTENSGGRWTAFDNETVTAPMPHGREMMVRENAATNNYTLKIYDVYGMWATMEVSNLYDAARLFDLMS